MIEAAILATIRARLDAALTGHRPPAHAIRVDGHAVGFVDGPRAARLGRFLDVFRRDGDELVLADALTTPEARSAALDGVARALAAEGALTAWRDERYAVRTSFDAPPLFHLERAAARYFGIHTFAAHANGLVFGGATASPRMWLARRSPRKAIDPGLLDNLVGGGIAGAESPAQTLRREAWEEAGIASLDATGPIVALTIQRPVPDGWQHETIFAYDLRLGDDFTPCNQDGEAVEHRLVDFAEAARLMANDDGPDVMTIDATLVGFDCVLRHAVPAGSMSSGAGAMVGRLPGAQPAVEPLDDDVQPRDTVR
jgi:8-oxo-dGTP pyrophosphatase MutT (NUDIX family)